MTCLSAARRAELITRLAKRQASLAIAETTYDTLLASDIESYKFDSTEGSQQTKRRKLDELKTQIDTLASEIARIQLKLNGGGIVNMGLRRYT